MPIQDNHNGVQKSFRNFFFNVDNISPKIVLIILCFIIFQCKHHSSVPEFSLRDFKNVKNLNGKPYRLQNAKWPVDICVIPSRNLLFIIDIQDTVFIKAYQLDNLAFISGFAKKGLGPNDQLDCHKLQSDSQFKYLYAADMDKNKIFVYSIDDILNKKKAITPINDIQLDQQSYRPLILANGKIVDYSNNTDTNAFLFAFHDQDGKTLARKGNYPSNENKYSLNDLKSAFQGAFVVSKDWKHIVLTYFAADYIDLYDTSGTLKKRVHGPDIFEPEVTTKNYLGGKMIVPTKDNRNAYSSPKMSSSSIIYALYSGSETKKSGYHADRILTFNDQLQPLTILRLDHYIFGFDIDNNGKTVYALNHKLKDNFLIKYELP